jgi:uncharacterized protein YsxB (DUF464 family)
MIRVNYSREGDRHRLSIEGHAGYDNSGRDIVCSGVSALSLALFAYLPDVAVIHKAQYSSGALLIDCAGGTAVQAAFDMAMTGYLHISAKYPQCVDVYIASDGG